MTDDIKEKRHWVVWIIVITFAGVMLTGGAIMWQIYDQRKPLLILPVGNGVELRLEGVLTQKNNVFDSHPAGMRIVEKLPKRLRLIMSRIVTFKGQRYETRLDKGEIGLVFSIGGGDRTARTNHANNRLMESEDRGYYLQVQNSSGSYHQPRRLYSIIGGLYTIGDFEVPENLKNLQIQLVENPHGPDSRVIHAAVFSNPLYDGNSAN